MSFPVVMRLLSHPRIKTAKTVMLYYSLPDEVDTHTLVDSLLMSGTHILLPRVTGEGTMELRRYTGPSDLTQGAYNIMEPTGEVFDDYAAIDLAVIPGVAFDSDAHRVEQIVKLVSGDGFGQIFITDTNRDHLDQILRSVSYDYKLFEVEGGEIREK